MSNLLARKSPCTRKSASSSPSFRYTLTPGAAARAWQGTAGVAGTAGQQDNRTAGQQDSRTGGQQDSRTAGQLRSGAAQSETLERRLCLLFLRQGLKRRHGHTVLQHTVQLCIACMQHQPRHCCDIP
jgi:hypothetical protein